MTHKWIWFYPFILFLYSIYSFVHVDPNLVLSSNATYWDIQNLFWIFGGEFRDTSTLIYLILILASFGLYFGIVKLLKKNKLSLKSVKYLVIACGLSLMISYPALSHDVYNYAFNAKMVLEYGSNPHIQTALDFPKDQWLMFMHNVHTPAPYGYGWTLISLVPSFLSGQYLQLVIMLFRVMMVGFLILLGWAQYKLAEDKLKIWVFVFLLNPLVLIETISNIHNDVVMMALLLWSVYLFRLAKKKGDNLYILLGIILFLMSVSIKFASILLIIGVILFEMGKILKKRISWGGSESIALFLPLLTKRSQRFLPWYLIWSLSFLPLTKEPLIREVSLVFSLSAMLSYLPFLYLGEYSQETQMARIFIIFSLPIIFLVYKLAQLKRDRIIKA